MLREEITKERIERKDLYEQWVNEFGGKESAYVQYDAKERKNAGYINWLEWKIIKERQAKAELLELLRKAKNNECGCLEHIYCDMEECISKHETKEEE